MSKPLILFGLHYIGHYTHVGGATGGNATGGSATGGNATGGSATGGSTTGGNAAVNQCSA